MFYIPSLFNKYELEILCSLFLQNYFKKGGISIFFGEKLGLCRQRHGCFNTVVSTRLFQHGCFNMVVSTWLFLSDEVPTLETLNFAFYIGNTPIFLYFDLYLYTANAAHYVYFIKQSTYNLTVTHCLGMPSTDTGSDHTIRL